jgi:hypothetical protein
MANSPMPTGGRTQSVAVGLTFPFVFRSRFRTGPVGSRTLSGNAVGGETRHEGSNPSRSALRLWDKDYRLSSGFSLHSARTRHGAADAKADAKGHGRPCSRTRAARIHIAT